MKSPLPLLLSLLVPLTLSAQTIEYTHLGTTYPIAGGKNGVPFQMKNGREIPVPRGGTFRIVDPENFDAADYYLLPFYSIVEKMPDPLPWEGPVVKTLELSEVHLNPYIDPSLLEMEGAFSQEQLTDALLVVIWMREGKPSMIVNTGLFQYDVVARRGPLKQAIEDGDGYPLLALVKDGKLVGPSDVKLPPALCAASIGNIDVLGKLASKELKAEDSKGNSALHRAALYGQLPAVKFLLDAGLSPKKKNKSGHTPLMLAAMGRRIEVARALCAYGDVGITDKNKMEENILHIAARSGSRTLMDLFLEYEPVQRLIDKSSQRGYTPMDETINSKMDDLYAQMRQFEDAPDYKARMADIDEAIIGFAAFGAVHSLRDLLKAGADPKKGSARNALAFAAAHANKETFELLLDFGMEIDAGEDATPLLVAAEMGRADVVRYLLEKGAKINAEAKSGATALWLAVRGEHEEVVSILLEHGADTAKGFKVPPLELALYLENPLVINSLVNAGAVCAVDAEKVDQLLERAMRNDVSSVLEAALGSCITPDHKLYGRYSISWAADYYGAERMKAALAKLSAGSDVPQFSSLPELDARPSVQRATAIDYPQELWAKHGEFEARIRIIVDNEGRVRLPKIVSCPVPAMRRRLVEAVSSWVWTPPTLGGKPAETQFIIPFNVQIPSESEMVWNVNELDSGPKPLRQDSPIYPAQARIRGLGGTVMMQFVVDTTGQTRDIECISGPIEFVHCSVKAIKKWRFQPGVKDGKPVNCRVQISVPYRVVR